MSRIDLSDVTWRKSSRSQVGGTECVEIGVPGVNRLVRDPKDPYGGVLASGATAWHKSSQTQAAGECVELACSAGQRLVRDSKNPDGPVLIFGDVEWQVFLDRVKSGAHDLGE